jgi:hypothetical protein
LTKFFGWNIRETNKPLEKKKHSDSMDSGRDDENMYSFDTPAATASSPLLRSLHPDL